MMPRLYAIADASVLGARGVRLEDFARELRAAGVELVQYRDKTGSPREVLRAAAVLRAVFSSPTSQNRDMGHPSATLIMNDRADLAVLAGFDGVHVGQGDLSPQDARRVVGPGRIVGVSTHTEDQVVAADPTSQKQDPSTSSGQVVGHPAFGPDYIAIGPVFATGTKADTEPVVGLEGVRRARALTRKPLVAIGGITQANARSAIDAGADSVAVISGLFSADESVEQVARDFLELLG
jgi:thiamine-phosphate pyrophosphorylase